VSAERLSISLPLGLVDDIAERVAAILAEQHEPEDELTLREASLHDTYVRTSGDNAVVGSEGGRNVELWPIRPKHSRRDSPPRSRRGGGMQRVAPSSSHGSGA
jgi:hypothetical protein